MAKKDLESKSLAKVVEDLKIMQIKLLEDLNDYRSEDKELPQFKDLAFKFTVIQTLMFIITRLI